MDRPKCGWYANRRLRIQYTFVWCVCVFFFCLVHDSVHISASILLRALCLFVYFVFRDLFGECGELHFIWLSIWLLRCILKMRIYIQWPLFWRIQIRTVFDIKSMSTKCPRTITHTHRRCTSIVYWFHFLENPIWIGFRLNSCFFYLWNLRAPMDALIYSICVVNPRPTALSQVHWCLRVYVCCVFVYVNAWRRVTIKW